MSGKTHAAVRRVGRDFVGARGVSVGQRDVPEEVPVAFSLLGTTYAVMMASPVDLHDFAVGFCLSEEIVGRADEIESVDAVEVDGGLDLQIRLVEAVQKNLKTRQRSMAGPVGCGLCGIESVEAALRAAPPVVRDLEVSAGDVMDAVASLKEHQAVNKVTHAVHAAGFYVPGTGIVAVREDVGRHNALDKLVGCLAVAGIAGGSGFVVLSSRVSLEMVQKTARLGAPLLAAVSAPTALALDVAALAGVCVVAVARDDAFEVFTHRDFIMTTDMRHVG